MFCIYWNLVAYAYFLVFAYYAYHYILCIFCSRQILERCFLFITILPLFPILWPSCSCTTTCVRHCRFLFYCPLKAYVSLLIWKGVVQVLPTGTRGNHPSMEDTGMMYKTFAVSLRSYTMVG